MFVKDISDIYSVVTVLGLIYLIYSYSILLISNQSIWHKNMIIKYEDIEKVENESGSLILNGNNRRKRIMLLLNNKSKKIILQQIESSKSL